MKTIQQICQKYNITNYTINPDGFIDVDGDVYLSYQNLDKLPLKFNRVSGYFYCSNNKLTSLEGAPKEVIGNFYCFYNNLTSLDGAPQEVGGYFYCHKNPLPQEIIDNPKGYLKSLYREEIIDKILKPDIIF